MSAPTAPPAGVRSRRGIGGRALLVVLVLVLVGSSCTGEDAQQRANRELTNDQRVQQAKISHLAAFEDVPWADALKAEQDDLYANALPVDPRYGAFTSPTVDGQFTNSADGERWTLQLPCEGCPQREVWLFGTSAAFGLGQRDDFTVASQLVRRAVADGVGLRVRNFAVPGRTQIQEYEGLLAHFRIDEGRPDLVLFLDGFNDVIASYMYAGVYPGKVLDPIKFDDTWTAAYLDKDPAPTMSSAEIAKVADHVASSYAEVQDEIRAAAAREGVDVAFAWQPDGFVSWIQLDGLRASLNGATTKVTRTTALSRLLDQVTGQLGDRIHNLRRPMAAYPDPVFADTTHFNETGAAFIADIVWTWIEPGLR